RTATSIWPGRLWRRRSLHSASARRRRAFMNARSASVTQSWRPRRWHTSWHEPATTCCKRTSRSTYNDVLHKGLARGGEPTSRLVDNHVSDWTPPLGHWIGTDHDL